MNAALTQCVWSRAGSCCEYCLMPQTVHVLTFPIDHVIARQHGGETVESNLALSCTRCNSYKGPNIAGLDPETGVLTRLLHPRTDAWAAHFRMIGPAIEGLTPIGRTTVFVLQFNHEDYIALRSSLIAEEVFGELA